MEINYNEVLNLHENFKKLFIQTIYWSEYEESYVECIKLAEMNSNILKNKNELKKFQKIISYIIEIEKTNYEDHKRKNGKDSLLYLVFNKEIINLSPEKFLREIKNWIIKLYKNGYYSKNEFDDDMEILLLTISEFVDNYKIEIKITKKENLKMIFKEELAVEIQEQIKNVETLIEKNMLSDAAMKIESIYVNYFLKYYMSQEQINKLKLRDYLKKQNKILEKLNGVEEIDKMFTLISKIRNAIKDKETKKTKDKSTQLIREAFWNNEVSDKDRKAFIKLYFDSVQTLFNFLINTAN